MSDGPHIVSNRKPGPLRSFPAELSARARELAAGGEPEVPEFGANLYDMSTKPPPHNLQARVDPELLERFKAKAKEEDRTLKANIERAMRLYLGEKK